MIQIEGVSHRYGDREVLSDINLSLVEDRIAVIGANGSGKSTLIKVLAGVEEADSGGSITAGGGFIRPSTGRPSLPTPRACASFRVRMKTSRGKVGSPDLD